MGWSTRLETRNATVERNVGAPADLKESDENLTGDGTEIAAGLGGSLRPARPVSPKRPADNCAPEPCLKSLSD